MTASDSKRILIADADHETRTMLGLMLVGEGYEVSHAVSGREAVALHDRKPHHLIIIELGEDGFQVLAQLRLAPSPVKYIATFKKSRFPAKICRRMCEQLGAHCVLAKPITPEQLLAAVRSALD
jgi:two-component system alkaline phosphatase synthesis response regulator PhoP